MRKTDDVYYSEFGYTFIRIEDGIDYGQILRLGYNLHNGELVEDKIEYYEEREIIEDLPS